MTSFPDDVIVPMCSPRLAQGLRPIREAADLAGHTLIHGEITILTWRDWARQQGTSTASTLDADRGSTDRSWRSPPPSTASASASTACCWPSDELTSGKLVIVCPDRDDGPRSRFHPAGAGECPTSCHFATGCSRNSARRKALGGADRRSARRTLSRSRAPEGHAPLDR